MLQIPFLSHIGTATNKMCALKYHVNAQNTAILSLPLPEDKNSHYVKKWIFEINSCKSFQVQSLLLKMRSTKKLKQNIHLRKKKLRKKVINKVNMQDTRKRVKQNDKEVLQDIVITYFAFTTDKINYHRRYLYALPCT